MDPTVIEQTIERGVDPATLIEHPRNPRRSDDRLIEQLIRANGWYGTVTAQTSTRHVLVGNGRLRAARRIGMAVDVTWRDVDDDEALRILLGDNRASDLGVYDNAQLVELLANLAEGGGLEGTGYDDDALALLMTQLDAEGYGQMGHGLTPGERQAAFDAADVRTIVLPYPAETYQAVVAWMIELRKRLDLDSFADLVAVLVEQAATDTSAEP